MKNLILSLFVVSGFLSFQSVDINSVNDEHIIRQAIYTKVVTETRLPCQLQKVTRENDNKNFSETDAGFIVGAVPDSLRTYFIEAVGYLYKDRKSISFVRYDILIGRELNSNRVITISTIGYSKNKSYAIVYYELEDEDNQGNGAFAFLSKKECIWDIVCVDYVWKT